MADPQGRAADGKAVNRLFMNPALVSDVAGQQAAEPVGGGGGPRVASLELVLQQDLAYKRRRRVTKFPQEFAAVNQPLVGVQDEMPVGCCEV
jgi:hypothetical protein